MAGSTGQKLLVDSHEPLLHYPVGIPQQVGSIHTTWFASADVSHKTPSTSWLLPVLIIVPTLLSSTQIVPSTSTNPKLLPHWFLRVCFSLLKPSKTFVHRPTPSHRYTLLLRSSSIHRTAPSARLSPVGYRAIPFASGRPFQQTSEIPTPYPLLNHVFKSVF